MPTSPSRYTRTAVLIHWLSAALVFVLIGVGWFMIDLPKGPQRSEYFALHKSLGLTVFSLRCYVHESPGAFGIDRPNCRKTSHAGNAAQRK